MSNQTQHFDLVIVGAGLVGASLACAIAQQENAQSLRIALIEAGSDVQHFSGENFDPRVVALTQASQELLTSIGVWDEIAQERICAYRDMHVWDGEGTAEIHFNCAEVRARQLGHIVENSVILASLQNKITQHTNITLIQPARIVTLNNGSGVEVELDTGEILSARLLIAADGAQSKVRELAEFETREWDYGHKAIVTTVQTELPNQATAWQRFVRTGPLAFLPLSTINE